VQEKFNSHRKTLFYTQNAIHTPLNALSKTHNGSSSLHKVGSKRDNRHGHGQTHASGVAVARGAVADGAVIHGDGIVSRSVVGRAAGGCDRHARRIHTRSNLFQKKSKRMERSQARMVLRVGKDKWMSHSWLEGNAEK
jgi:hypothetical protein